LKISYLVGVAIALTLAVVYALRGDTTVMVLQLFLAAMFGAAFVRQQLKR